MHEDAFALQFDPREKELVMVLDKYTCHKERTGVCSLDLSDMELSEESGAETCMKSAKNYCRQLYEDFLKKGIQDKVYIEKCSCGHYDISDGQHRLCIAKHKELSVPAYISERKDGVCFYCLSLQKSILSKISSLFTKKDIRRGRYFIRK